MYCLAEARLFYVFHVSNSLSPPPQSRNFMKFPCRKHSGISFSFRVPQSFSGPAKLCRRDEKSLFHPAGNEKRVFARRAEIRNLSKYGVLGEKCVFVPMI